MIHKENQSISEKGKFWIHNCWEGNRKQHYISQAWPFRYLRKRKLWRTTIAYVLKENSIENMNWNNRYIIYNSNKSVSFGSRFYLFAFLHKTEIIWEAIYNYMIDSKVWIYYKLFFFLLYFVKLIVLKYYLSCSLIQSQSASKDNTGNSVVDNSQPIHLLYSDQISTYKVQRKWVLCVVLDNYSHSNLSCNFIHLPFICAPNIDATSGLVRVSWDSGQNPKKNIIWTYLASTTVLMSFPYWYLDILNLNIVLNWHFGRTILLLKFLEATVSSILIISSLALLLHWWWFWLQVIDDF